MLFLRKIGILLLVLLPTMIYAANIEVFTESPVMPLLTNRQENPCLKILLIRKSTESVTVNAIHLKLSGTSGIKDISAARAFMGGSKLQFSEKFPLSKSIKVAESFSIPLEMTCTKDTTCIWVSLSLKNDIDLLQQLSIHCVSVSVNTEELVPVELQSQALRVGVAVRKSGEDGVKDYRIPGLATSNKGTLLAIYDTRIDRIRDLQGNIDIGLSRSMDHGRTWKEMQIVLDQEQWGGLPEKYNGVSDACILVDKQSNNIFVAGLWMHGLFDPKTGEWVTGLTEQSTEWNHQWKSKGSGPGYGERQTCQFLITQSSDDGKTWSKPINLTKLKRENWWLLAPAPGRGITMRNGTLVFPAQGRDSIGKSFSTIVYSDDHGNTWKMNNPAMSGTTECAVAELSNGDLMLNMRSSKQPGRAVVMTSDLGKTWQIHPTSHSALIEPVCMASLIRHEYVKYGKKKSVLLFCNPNSTSSRVKMTIKMSFDDGKTWPEEKWIMLNELKSAGYSCLSTISDTIIGVFYEGSYTTMTFQQIDISSYLE